jgi:hypothetical protein
VQLVLYADESGTHGHSNKGREPAPCICGFIASPDYWKKFCSDWKIILNKHGAPYWHSREFTPAAREKQKSRFFGWSNERVDNLMYDLGFVIAQEAVPVGSFVQSKRSPDPLKRMADGFFKTSLDALNRHWPKFDGRVSFVFESQKTNKEWERLLNDAHQKYTRKDNRIGSFSFLSKHNPQGIPLQAADMLAFSNRQAAQRIFEDNARNEESILGMMLYRNLHPKNHPRRFNGSDAKWELAIRRMIFDKGTKDTTRIVLGEPKKHYHPFKGSYFKFD